MSRVFFATALVLGLGAMVVAHTAPERDVIRVSPRAAAVAATPAAAVVLASEPRREGCTAAAPAPRTKSAGARSDI